VVRSVTEISKGISKLKVTILGIFLIWKSMDNDYRTDVRPLK
jgi:hypothetical protein